MHAHKQHNGGRDIRVYSRHLILYGCFACRNHRTVCKRKRSTATMFAGSSVFSHVEWTSGREHDCEQAERSVADRRRWRPKNGRKLFSFSIRAPPRPCRTVRFTNMVRNFNSLRWTKAPEVILAHFEWIHCLKSVMRSLSLASCESGTT